MAQQFLALTVMVDSQDFDYKFAKIFFYYAFMQCNALWYSVYAEVSMFENLRNAHSAYGKPRYAEQISTDQQKNMLEDSFSRYCYLKLKEKCTIEIRQNAVDRNMRAVLSMNFALTIFIVCVVVFVSQMNSFAEGPSRAYDFLNGDEEDVN